MNKRRTIGLIVAVVVILAGSMVVSLDPRPRKHVVLAMQIPEPSTPEPKGENPQAERAFDKVANPPRAVEPVGDTAPAEPLPTAAEPASTQANVGDEPMAAVEEFLNRKRAFLDRNREEAAESIKALISEARALRARLQKVEAALSRWQGIAQALDRGADPSAGQLPAPGPRNRWNKPDPEPSSPQVDVKPKLDEDPILAPAPPPAVPPLIQYFDPKIQYFDPKISAPGPKLEGKKILVLARVVPGVAADLGDLARELSRGVISSIREKVAKLAVVSPDEVTERAAAHPSSTDPVEAAKAFDADVAIVLDVTRFDTEDSRRPGLMRGESRINIQAWEVAHHEGSKGRESKSQPKELTKVYEGQAETTFPARGPVPEGDGVFSSSFRTEFLKLVAAKVSRHFVDSSLDDDISDMTFNPIDH